MTEDKPPSLEDLGARLKKARKGAGDGASDGRGGVDSFGFGQAMRVALEMVAALGVSGGIGWYLDRWLGTKPALLLVFVVLGLAAGIRTALRAARHIEARADEQRQADNGDKR
ncbi:MAG: AtpZ/AtpI family protein [Alphaproteobacteria bacterium]|nr:AtpZ/AtpI family protein [Alphaproteobacteria bacterium]